MEPVKRTLIVTLYRPQKLLPFPHTRTPAGVTVSGLTGPVTNGQELNDALSFTVSFATNIEASIVGAWLYERIVNHKAERVRINNQEPVDEKDLHRIVREELEIGHND